jgi:hypothetical protein
MSKITKEKNATASEHSPAGAASNKLVLSQSNAVQIFADYSVWDTVANKYLVEGKDYNAKDIFRNG